MLNGIYYTEENPMDDVNATLQKGQEGRRNKCQMFKLKEYKHKEERAFDNQISYLQRLHLNIHLAQVNMLKFLPMRLLLMLVRVRINIV